ncbi:MAG TPA: GNAT family protein [Candidatus Limnocylindrales bacterium]|nr:GNAT family protein [Candidatus Limnocylindrales bacterium]
MSTALRPIRADDWQAVHRWAQLIEVCRYQPWGPNTPQQTQEFIELEAQEWEVEPQQRYPFVILVNGMVSGLAALNPRPFHQAEITYSLHPEHWGRGIATEAARELLRLGFAEHGLHRIFGMCDPRNVASGKVMRKVGMVHEGRLRQNVLIRDGWRDSDVYSILRPEWGPRF